MQLDDKKKIYAQKMNENIAQTVSNSKGNTSNWKISTYTPRKGTEIYIVGNTFLAISDSKPRIIKSFNPSNWIEKL